MQFRPFPLPASYWWIIGCKTGTLQRVWLVDWLIDFSLPASYWLIGYRLQDWPLVVGQPSIVAPTSSSIAWANDRVSGEISGMPDLWFAGCSWIIETKTDLWYHDFLHTEAKCYGGKEEADGPLVGRERICTVMAENSRLRGSNWVTRACSSAKVVKICKLMVIGANNRFRQIPLLQRANLRLQLRWL